MGHPNAGMVEFPASALERLPEEPLMDVVVENGIAAIHGDVGTQNEIHADLRDALMSQEVPFNYRFECAFTPETVYVGFWRPGMSATEEHESAECESLSLGELDQMLDRYAGGDDPASAQEFVAQLRAEIKRREALVPGLE